jgi:hypothetical protein
MKRMICLFVSLSVIVVACKKDTEEPTPSGVDCSTVTYSGTIAGIVNSKCATAGCHAAGSANGDYTSYPGIKAKYDNGSLKKEVITDKTMPQGSSLTDTQYQQFECWINAGAPNN